MSELQILIKQLCPDEVEFVSLNNVADVSTGTQLNKELLTSTGKYPVYNGGIYPSGYYHEYNTNSNTISISQGGASAGWVNWLDTPFFAGAHCYVVVTKDENVLNEKYLFYFVKNNQEQIMNSKQGAGIPGLNRQVLHNLSVPIPPLEVQHEIVRILDNLTELTVELTTELTAELTARKKQYEYYRDSLLTFGDNVPMVTLGGLAIKTYSGATPLANKSEYYNEGTIPWLRTQEVRFTDIFYTDIKITPLALSNTAAKWVPENCVIIAISGATAGRSAINKIPLTTNQHCFCIEIDNKKALYRYVFYWVCNKYEDLKSLGQGARADLNSTIIKNYPIPLPSLEEQARIVAILDKFDALTTDITSALPAEIDARHKQYEYYRDKLLTFKELEV